jgi:S1-C subfamily serine protease
VVGEFIGHGRVRRAHLGIAAQTVTLPRRIVAARVSEVETDGPAARGGIVVGDVILALDDISVTGVDDLIRLLGADRIERSVEVTVLRNGRAETIVVTPAERRRPD